MRFPSRLRGLMLGVSALVAGPTIAVALTSPQAAHHPAAVAVAQPAGPAQLTERAVHVNDYMLRPRAPLPPPTPAPTPTPKPRPRPAAVSVPPPWTGDVVSIIRAAAARWGVSGDWMVNIAHCESGLRPNAYNPSGPYYGLFQFLMSTFTHNGGTNIWDPSDQANIAAKMLAHGQAHQWSCA